MPGPGKPASYYTFNPRSPPTYFVASLLCEPPFNRKVIDTASIMAATIPNTAEHHILQHPTNPVHNTRYTTSSDKQWARRYKPIANIVPRTSVVDGVTYADFEAACLPLYDDDTVRMNEFAVEPNPREWRFEVEADCENWFNSEISNVVLAAWMRYPALLQTSHNKPLTEETISENVDSTYSTKIGNQRVSLVIGEMKRNLIAPQDWQAGDISTKGVQKKLSQELRGCVRHAQSQVCNSAKM